MYLHIHAVKNTTVCQMVSLCNMQHNVIYNCMFWPYKRAIVRLFVEPVRWLYNGSLGGLEVGWGFCWFYKQTDDGPLTRPKHV